MSQISSFSLRSAKILRHATSRVYRQLINLLPASWRTSLKLKFDIPLDNNEATYLVRALLHSRKSTSRSPKIRVLFWGAPGVMSSILTVEAAIATALRLRQDMDIRFIVCDAALSGCISRDTKITSWNDQCIKCHREATNVMSRYDLQYMKLGDLVSEDAREKLRTMANEMPESDLAAARHDGVDIGRYALSSVIRYSRSGKLHEEYMNVFREYLYSSLITTEAAVRAINDFKPDYVVMTHGIYEYWGPVLAKSLDLGIPVIGWTSGYLKNHFYLRYFQPDSSSIIFNRRGMSDESWRSRMHRELAQHEEKQLDDYMDARYKEGVANDIKIESTPRHNQSESLLHFGNSGDRPIWCIFTHIVWDAVFSHLPSAYDSLEQWLIDTIETIKKNQSIMWLIKLHPNELHNTPMERSALALIQKHFPELPAHVRVIPSDTNINNLCLYQILSGGVTLYGTAGLELALQGKPVILGGETHYGGKGFTYDGTSRDAYLSMLQKVNRLTPLSAEQHALARRYAYSYFIQRQIPLNWLNKSSKWWEFDFSALPQLLPGNDAITDMICDRIINGGDFMLDDHMLIQNSRLK